MFEGWGAAMIGASVVSGVASSRASSRASGAQTQASGEAIRSEEARFAAIQTLLKPYVAAGTSSLTAQQDLLGLNGDEAQRNAISSIESSPQMQALVQQGEEGILQNASATGGLRGGNTQSAVAQFRPAVLGSLIESQFNKLGGITQIGQAAAAGQASAGLQTGSNISGLIQQRGAAQAGNYLAQGQAVGNFANSLGTFTMMNGAGVF